jgi:hypothetical protein
MTQQKMIFHSLPLRTPSFAGKSWIRQFQAASIKKRHTNGGKGGRSTKISKIILICTLIFPFFVAKTLIAQESYSILIGTVKEVRSGTWLAVESEKDKTVFNLRIGYRTIYRPSRYPNAGEKVKVEYSKHQDALVAYTVTIVDAETGKPLAPVPEKGDRPLWNVGDSWKFRYPDKKEWQQTVERIEGNLYILNDPSEAYKLCVDQRTLSIVAYLNSEGRKIEPSSVLNLYFNFPLHLGKKWARIVTVKARGTAYELNYINDYRVVSYEDINVPAGKFKAFKIELNLSADTRSPYNPPSGTAHIYYSPEVKFYTKVLFNKSKLWLDLQEFELISFNLIDKQSPTEKISPPRENPQTSLPATPPPSGNAVTVTGTFANIRSGAGNEFPIVTTLRQGDKVILLGEKGEWFHVRLENGEEGWVNNKFAK